MKAKIRSVIRLAWPYILMVLLPVISVFFLSSYILSNHTQQLVEDQSSSLDVAVDRVDQKIHSIAELSYLIAENDTVLEYVINGMTGVENDAFAYDDIQDLLSGVSKNDNIAEIYFYDASTGRIIATETSLSDAEMFFRYRYQFLDTSPAEAVTKLQGSRWGYGYSDVQEILVDNKLMEIIEYRISVPVDRFGIHQSQLIISLNTQDLFQDFF